MGRLTGLKATIFGGRDQIPPAARRRVEDQGSLDQHQAIRGCRPGTHVETSVVRARSPWIVDGVINAVDLARLGQLGADGNRKSA